MRQPEVLQSRPLWQWKHGDSPKAPRPSHIALHNKVFEASESFWDIAYPPCAYGCRCKVVSLKRRQVEAMGLRIETPPDPNSIAEPGFRRSPGTTLEEERQAVLQNGLSRLSPQLQRQVEVDLSQRGLLGD